MEKLIKKEEMKVSEEIHQDIIVPVPEEKEEKKINLNDFLTRLAPGKTLRVALDDILEGESGALIVIDCPGLKELIDGGFKINTNFTAQKLAELAKMDGAIIISKDLRKILMANVLLVPKASILTNETGTRHKAAERTAKQLGTFVIAVSERRNKISIFYEDKKHILEDSESILRRATETLNILEKQRELLDDAIKNLNILEITGLVSIGDVCTVLQRIEVINKMMDTMKRYLTELGNQGIILRMRIKEIFKGIENIELFILKDYSHRPSVAKRILSSITFEGIIDPEALSRMIFESPPDIQIEPLGYRMLDKLNLNEREVKLLIDEFNNLSNIFNASEEELAVLLKNRAINLKKELDSLKEQILVGKKL